MNIKVQLPNRRPTVEAFTESGFENARVNVLTFHAFSDTMKARLLEYIAKGEVVWVQPTEEPFRTGEWLEPPMGSE